MDYISVMVTGPDKEVLYETRFRGEGAQDKHNSEGVFDFDSKSAGVYTMCISNGTPKENDGTARVVGFNFREMYLTDDMVRTSEPFIHRTIKRLI